MEVLKRFPKFPLDILQAGPRACISLPKKALDKMQKTYTPYGDSPDAPIRMSSLNSMMECPMMAYHSWRARQMTSGDGSSYISAHTGTALGLLIELFHRGDSRERATKRVKDASEIGMGDRPHPFPRADWKSAELAFSRYIEDPRNSDKYWPVIPESLEKEVYLELPDIKGKPIFFEGHIDQCRLTEDGLWEVWDVKFSDIFSPPELLSSKIAQLAFYALGLENEGIPASIGGIIAPRQYTTKPGLKKAPGDIKGAFTRGSWNLRDAQALSRLVALEVSRIRYGQTPLKIGPHCDFCEVGKPKESFKGGFQYCSKVFNV